MNWTTSGTDKDRTVPCRNEESGPDPYAVLGVSRDASYEVIRRSYREKAKFCHPDLGSEPGREEEFKRLSWAHRILAEQRRKTKTGSNSAPSGQKSGVQKATPTGPSPIAELLAEGRERLQRGSAMEAERLARLALQRVRGDTNAYVLLSEALGTQKRYAEAVGCLLMALQIDKRCEPAWEALTKLQERGDAG